MGKTEVSQAISSLSLNKTLIEMKESEKSDKRHVGITYDFMYPLDMRKRL